MAKHPSDMHKKMRGRNIALVSIIFAFVILIAVVTYIKLGGGA